MAGRAAEPYREFMRRQEAKLLGPEVREAERHLGLAALHEMWLWLVRLEEDPEALARMLAAQYPEGVYRRLVEARERRAREEEERWRAVEVKLEEYLQWCMRLVETHAQRFRRLEPGYLLTESPLREKSIDALARAVLAWAYSHTEDPEFLKRSPAEVALYLLASRSALATAIELGKEAPPHLDYTPPRREVYEPEEMLLELVVGFYPVLGEADDLRAFLSGYSLTGHRLSEGERLVHLFGVLIPFASGKLLKEGREEALQQVALLTGRSLDEVQVLSRVARQMSPEEVREVERILGDATARGGKLTEQELTFLQRVAGKVEKPLREAAEVLGRGGKVPLMGARAGAEGLRLVPGSPEHMAQCWIDYQFRHPGRYPRFTYAVDEEWQRLYRSILKNKGVGNAFEDTILRKQGYEKNTALMMPPPGSKVQGFIADSVRDNPEQLVWGHSYRFIEVKARKELALTGNLKAMIDYVKVYGGHLELWIRSAKHPAGGTRLTAPLQRELNRLQRQGKAIIKEEP